MQGIWLCNLLSHKSNLGPTKRKHEDILKLRGGRSGLSCGSQKWALVTLPQQNASARRPPTCITGKLRIDPRAVPQRIGMRRETDKGKAQAPTRSHMLASLRQSTLLPAGWVIAGPATLFEPINEFSIYGWLGWYCSFEFAGRVEGGGRGG